MTVVNDRAVPLQALRAAVGDMIEAAEAAASHWTVPRGPGKWSPSQVLEHVARSLDESANIAAGHPAKFPVFPAFLRPVVRILLFNRVLRTGTFPKARTNRALDPAEGPATPAAGRARLEAALAAFERECGAGAGATVATATFGVVTLDDFIRFQEIHTRYHRKQMSPA